MKVKKSFQAIHNLLEQNKDSKIGDIWPQISELLETKSTVGRGAAPQYKINEEGEVIAIMCYYFKKWFDPRIMPFGSKAGSKTGLSNMCKEGTKHFVTRNNDIKNVSATVLTSIIEGEIGPNDAEARKAELIAEAKIIKESTSVEGYPGFNTLEECIEFSNNNPEKLTIEPVMVQES